MLSTTNKPSNVNSSCEQCGGQMKITTTDRHNKIMECLYCGHIVDVPDKINTNDYAEFFANVSGNGSISPTITLHSNNLISLGSHDIFKNDIFDGAFSNLSHQSFFTNSNIPEDIQSVFRELLSDQSFNELGGVSRTYTRVTHHLSYQRKEFLIKASVPAIAQIQIFIP